MDIAAELALEARGSRAIASYSLQGHETMVPPKSRAQKMLHKVQTLDFGKLEDDGVTEEAVAPSSDAHKPWLDMNQRVQAAQEQLAALADVLKLVRKTDYLTTVPVAQPSCKPDLPVLLTSKRRALKHSANRLAAALNELKARVHVDNQAAEQLTHVCQRYRCRHSKSAVVVDCGLADSHLGESADLQASLVMPKGQVDAAQGSGIAQDALPQAELELRKPLQCTAPLWLSSRVEGNPAPGGIETAAAVVKGEASLILRELKRTHQSILACCAFESLCIGCQAPAIAQYTRVTDTYVRFDIPAVDGKGSGSSSVIRLEQGMIVSDHSAAQEQPSLHTDDHVRQCLLLVLEATRRNRRLRASALPRPGHRPSKRTTMASIAAPMTAIIRHQSTMACVHALFQDLSVTLAKLGLAFQCELQSRDALHRSRWLLRILLNSGVSVAELDVSVTTYAAMIAWSIHTTQGQSWALLEHTLREQVFGLIVKHAAQTFPTVNVLRHDTVTLKSNQRVYRMHILPDGDVKCAEQPLLSTSTSLDLKQASECKQSALDWAQLEGSDLFGKLAGLFERSSEQ
eukprot:TRINITY_DN8556_c0_g1_i1.p1 TRINITY_DN8556_c0_g1~~TRINITY_DN8556_c0_g1_i1.p1  ORF type:complete len:597 (+),score=118.40 TRINITY_DN8556_c0_g1_i1:79-1791(+)